MTAISNLLDRLANASAETILLGITVILILVIALLWDRIINGSDASNSFRRHNDDR